jgi:hypothetical protein
VVKNLMGFSSPWPKPENRSINLSWFFPTSTVRSKNFWHLQKDNATFGGKEPDLVWSCPNHQHPSAEVFFGRFGTESDEEEDVDATVKLQQTFDEQRAFER